MKYTVLATAILLAAGTASAQNIERVKMTDNDLTCQQVYGEIGQMDAIIARASQPVMQTVAATDPNAAQGGQVAGQVVGAVAQTAAARSGFGGFGGFGGLGGALGGMIGGIAQQAAASQQQQAQAQQQQAAMQQQQNAALGQQAQARKDHLTGVFLSKGCKMSDVQK